MDEVLYHVEIGLPASFVAPTGVIHPVYSRHAQRAASDDRYGNIDLPEMLPLHLGRVVEVGYINGRCSKILFRFRYDDSLDMCVVLIPGTWFVKTVWFNERGDLHGTLDRTRYQVA